MSTNPKPREWWCVVGQEGKYCIPYDTREDAEAMRDYISQHGTHPGFFIGHMVEVV